MKKILVCDDQTSFTESLVRGLKEIEFVSKNFDVEFLSDRLGSAIEALENRLVRSTKEGTQDFPDDEAKPIDEAAILVIDYRLIYINASITGERAAYLARCYSRCGLIVGLNQFQPYVDEYFDLTLKGHPESYADLNIPSNSLFNPGLWFEPWKGFRPWYWPLLPKAVEEYERRVDDIAAHLDESILSYLGIDRVKSVNPSRTVAQFIMAPKNSNPSETTFRDFVESSGNGLRGRVDIGEKPLSDTAIARIAAARIYSWLENMILPGQDTLVDAPHLISRYPSLSGTGVQDIDAWNGIASFDDPTALGLDTVIEPFRFQKQDWLSRSAWFWSEISNCERIKEVSDPWSVERPKHVFCEDVSRFVPQEEAKGFVAELESPFVRRYVEYLDDIEYSPRVRFSL
jgi:hypothetical protein